MARARALPRETPAQLEAELAALERQLWSLRRRLANDVEALPTEPFCALEVEVAEHTYLLPIGGVREVVQAVWPSPLSGAPPWVRGTFRYGPRILPLIDLQARLHGRQTRLVPELAVAVLEQPKWVGVLIAPPRGLVEVAPAALCAPDPELSQSPWIVGTLAQHGDQGAHLLSVERLGREWVLEHG